MIESPDCAVMGTGQPTATWLIYRVIDCFVYSGGGGATLPLPRGGAWRNSTKTQQSGHAPTSGWIRGQNEEVVPKMAAGEAQMRNSQEGGESDHARGARRRCMKNSPSVLSCIGKRIKEGCDRGSEVGTVYSG